MKYEAVLELKQELLEDIDSKLNETGGLHNFEAIVHQHPEDRIAIGHSQIEQGNFRLELRIQRRDLWAFKYAEALIERVKSEANYEIIPRIEIPAGTAAKAQVRCTPIIDHKAGRLQIGLSIGPKDSGVGTLGAFLARSDGNYILSCNHVMVSGTKPQILDEHGHGDAIFHPGRESGYRLDATRRIATLANYPIVSRTEENELDCAIAKLEPSWNYDVTQVPKGFNYPNEGQTITAMKDPDQQLRRDMIMCKIGRTTCFTRGLLRAIDIARLPVFLPGEGNVVFSEVLEVRSATKDEPFSLPGDSGSLVYTETEKGLEAVGLVFAGGMREDGFKVSYVCKLNPILEWAKADLLN